MSNAVRKEEVDNLDFVTKVKDSHDMSYKELARLSEYSEEYVRSWFAQEGSAKYRAVPDRAVKIIKLKLKSEGPLI